MDPYSVSIIFYGITTVYNTVCTLIKSSTQSSLKQKLELEQKNFSKADARTV